VTTPTSEPASSTAPPARRRDIATALRRFQVIAIVVGVGLLTLVFIGMPLKYAADQTAVVAVIGPLHGFLYIVYLLASFDLAVRARLSIVRTILMMLAGTVPFLSFVAERVITREVRSRYAL
jgi:integral membrane protein